MRRDILVMAAVFAGAFLMLLITGQPSSAQSSTSPSPCANDIKEYCGTETPGGGRLLRCYEEKKDKMSSGCRAWAELAKQNASNVKDLCSKTIDARCNIEKGDPLAMVECLQSNYVDLTRECAEKLNEFKGRYPKPVK